MAGTLLEKRDTYLGICGANAHTTPTFPSSKLLVFENSQISERGAFFLFITIGLMIFFRQKIKLIIFNYFLIINVLYRTLMNLEDFLK